MTAVTVVVEGQSEEAFVNAVLAPAFAPNGLYLTPILIHTSRMAAGGGLTPARVLRMLRHALLQRRDAFVTTFFDLYGLDTGFPGFAEGSTLADPLARAALVERRLAEAVAAETDVRPERFLPHIQPYEFEALIFTDVQKLAEVEAEWAPFVAPLSVARLNAQSPEHINDGPQTHPSRRLGDLLSPRYQKVLHGAALIERIGLSRVRAECRHFGAWCGRLEALRPL